jgi:hypothetical protein
MKGFITGMLLMVCAAVTFAQTAPPQEPPLPDNVYSIGGSYNNGGSPAYALTAIYAKLLSNDAGTYGFTVIDVLPVSVKPAIVTTNIGVGIAQRVLKLPNGVNIFAPVDAGVSITGTNTGWSWTGGILADYVFKKNGIPSRYHLQPNVRFIKSSVSNGAGYQLIGGLNFGFGN